jgi:hypothetical protein
MNGPSEELKQRVRENQNKLKQLKLAEEVDNRSLLEREHPDFPINRKELKQNNIKNENMKILKYDSFVDYSLGLSLLKKKNAKVIYEGPANECTLDIDKTILNTVKWLIIKKT